MSETDAERYYNEQRRQVAKLTDEELQHLKKMTHKIINQYQADGVGTVLLRAKLNAVKRELEDRGVIAPRPNAEVFLQKNWKRLAANRLLFACDLGDIVQRNGNTRMPLNECKARYNAQIDLLDSIVLRKEDLDEIFAIVEEQCKLRKWPYWGTYAEYE